MTRKSSRAANVKCRQLESSAGYRACGFGSRECLPPIEIDRPFHRPTAIRSARCGRMPHGANGGNCACDAPVRQTLVDLFRFPGHRIHQLLLVLVKTHPTRLVGFEHPLPFGQQMPCGGLEFPLIPMLCPEPLN